MVAQHSQEVADAEAIAIQNDALMTISRFAEGDLRESLQLLGQVNLLSESVTANHVIEMTGGVPETDLLALLDAITTNDTFQLLKLARTLVDSGKTPKLILSSLLQIYRDLLILKSDPNASDLLTSPVSYNPSEAEEICLAERVNRSCHEPIQTAKMGSYRVVTLARTRTVNIL